MAPQRRQSRNKNPISPFERIKVACGLSWIKERFEEELINATVEERTVNLDALYQTQSEHLLKITNTPLTAPMYSCLVKNSRQDDTYPTFKVRLATLERLTALVDAFGVDQTKFDQTSVPLDLHRLAALKATDWDMSKISMEAIHRCHNKRCFNPEHVYFGTNQTNRSTDFCKVYTIVNGVLIQCCSHEPKCLAPGNGDTKK